MQPECRPSGPNRPGLSWRRLRYNPFLARPGKQHRWWHKHESILVLNRGAITLGLLVLFLGGASAVAATGQVPVSPEEVVQGNPGLPWISLVVNAGAGYEPAVEMLDLLAEKQLRTTFFLMGWWAE